MKGQEMKKLGFVAVGVLMVFILFTPFAMAKEYHFAVFLPTLDQPYFACHKYGYEDEAKKLGVKVTIYDAGGYPNVARQVQQIEDAIARKVNVIILIATSPTGTIAPVEEAVRAGIPVINNNVMCDSPKITARIRSDDIEVGKMAGEFLAKKLDQKGNIVMLPGKAGLSPIMLRAQGVKEVIKKYPRMKIVAEQWSEMTRAVGMNLIEDLLQRHGKDMHGIYAVGEHLAMGAAMALKAAKRPDVIVSGVDWSKDLETAIREGWVGATVTQTPIYIARLSMRYAKALSEGEMIPPMTFTPILQVTKDNLDKVDRGGFEIPSK